MYKKKHHRSRCVLNCHTSIVLTPIEPDDQSNSATLHDGTVDIDDEIKQQFLETPEIMHREHGK